MTCNHWRTTFVSVHLDRWAFDVELLYIAQQLDMPIGEVAVNWQEIDGSKLSPLEAALQMGRDLVRVQFHQMKRFYISFFLLFLEVQYSLLFAYLC